MSNRTVPSNALIVIATGEKAMLFRNTGDPQNIELHLAAELGPDDFDLEHNGVAGAPPESTDKENNEAAFIQNLADRLYKMAHAGEYDDLVLVLDPGSLGEIRPHLHKEVKNKLRMELGKTLINHSVADITTSLSSASS